MSASSIGFPATSRFSKWQGFAPKSFPRAVATRRSGVAAAPASTSSASRSNEASCFAPRNQSSTGSRTNASNKPNKGARARGCLNVLSVVSR